MFLAEHGFDVVGVDFSSVAIRKAWEKARYAPGAVRFVEGDLTAERIEGAEGLFDLLVDYGTLDDLRGDARRAMVRTIHRLSRSGTVFLLWCFSCARSELPWLSFGGPSKVYPGLAPGEERELFGEAFEIERLPEPPPSAHAACFLMTRR